MSGVGSGVDATSINSGQHPSGAAAATAAAAAIHNANYSTCFSASCNNGGHHPSSAAAAATAAVAMAAAAAVAAGTDPAEAQAAAMWGANWALRTAAARLLPPLTILLPWGPHNASLDDDETDDLGLRVNPSGGAGGGLESGALAGIELELGDGSDYGYVADTYVGGGIGPHGWAAPGGGAGGGSVDDTYNLPTPGPRGPSPQRHTSPGSLVDLVLSLPAALSSDAAGCTDATRHLGPFRPFRILLSHPTTHRATSSSTLSDEDRAHHTGGSALHTGGSAIHTGGSGGRTHTRASEGPIHTTPGSIHTVGPPQYQSRPRRAVSLDVLMSVFWRHTLLFRSRHALGETAAHAATGGGADQPSSAHTDRAAYDRTNSGGGRGSFLGGPALAYNSTSNATSLPPPALFDLPPYTDTLGPLATLAPAMPLPPADGPSPPNCPSPPVSTGQSGYTAGGRPSYTAGGGTPPADTAGGSTTDTAGGNPDDTAGGGLVYDQQRLGSVLLLSLASGVLVPHWLPPTTYRFLLGQGRACGLADLAAARCVAVIYSISVDISAHVYIKINICIYIYIYTDIFIYIHIGHF